MVTADLKKLYHKDRPIFFIIPSLGSISAVSMFARQHNDLHLAQLCGSTSLQSHA